MRDEYDFSNGGRNPYVKPTKSTGTIHLDKSTIDYFKSLPNEVNMPYHRQGEKELADSIPTTIPTKR